MPMFFLLGLGVLSLGHSTAGARFQGQLFFDVRIYCYILLFLLVAANFAKRILVHEVFLVLIITFFVFVKLAVGYGSGLFSAYIISFAPLVLVSILFFVRPPILDSYFTRRQSVIAFILFCFVVKYGYMKFFGFNARPQLLTENNIELTALLVGLTCFGKLRIINLALLSIVVFISGSLSATAAFCVFLLKSYKLNFLTILVAVPFISYFGFAFLTTKIAHFGSLTSIDRVLFSIVFFDEISSRSLVEIVFGDLDMSGLRPDNCYTLIGYQHMFGNGKLESLGCTSLPLHGSTFRIILDHGLFGFILFFVGIFYFLDRNVKIFFFVSIILILTGLSISSMHNILSFIALAFALFWRNVRDVDQTRGVDS